MTTPGITEATGIKKILVPLDGSDYSLSAAGYAINLAAMTGAKVVCIHAVATLPYMEHKSGIDILTPYLEEAGRHAERWYSQVNEMASEKGIQVESETLFNVASVADTIVQYAREHGIDLIVMGTKGRTGLKKRLLGSVASGVASHAGCPVLVVR